MDGVSKSSHCLYTVSLPPAVSQTRTAFVLELTQAVPFRGRKHMVGRSVHVIIGAFVSLPFLIPGHSAFRLSHAAQEPPLDCCPVRSSSPSPGCPVSPLPDTSRRCPPDKQCAVDWRGSAIPFKCSPSQRTPEIPVPNIRRRAQG